MAYQFGQIFRTQPVPATLPAFYQLSIRAPGGSIAEVATYTFAISPSQLRYEPGGMSRFADVQGTAAQGNPTGVARIMDTYGLSPPMITIEGTTGWDRHQTDGYVFTGVQSIQFLQAFLQRYAALNQRSASSAIRNSIPLNSPTISCSSFGSSSPSDHRLCAWRTTSHVSPTTASAGQRRKRRASRSSARRMPFLRRSACRPQRRPRQLSPPWAPSRRFTDASGNRRRYERP